MQIYLQVFPKFLRILFLIIPNFPAIYYFRLQSTAFHHPQKNLHLDADCNICSINSKVTQKYTIIKNHLPFSFHLPVNTIRITFASRTSP